MCAGRRRSHHMRLLSRLALRTGLAAVAGLVEELVLSATGMLRASKHAAHLNRDRRRWRNGD